jgi:excisionase family DNA binding protein
MEKDVYTAEEAAEYLALRKDGEPDATKVKRLARNHKIGHIRVGRDYLFRKEHITQYLDDNEVRPTPTKPNAWGLSDSSLKRIRQQG